MVTEESKREHNCIKKGNLKRGSHDCKQLGKKGGNEHNLPQNLAKKGGKKAGLLGRCPEKRGTRRNLHKKRRQKKGRRKTVSRNVFKDEEKGGVFTAEKRGARPGSRR